MIDLFNRSYDPHLLLHSRVLLFLFGNKCLLIFIFIFEILDERVIPLHSGF
jgi:hypothetical protein